MQAEALEAAKAEGKDMGADLVLYKRMAQVHGPDRAAASVLLLVWCCCGLAVIPHSESASCGSVDALVCCLQLELSP